MRKLSERVFSQILGRSSTSQHVLPDKAGGGQLVEVWQMFVVSWITCWLDLFSGLCLETCRTVDISVNKTCFQFDIISIPLLYVYHCYEHISSLSCSPPPDSRGWRPSFLRVTWRRLHQRVPGRRPRGLVWTEEEGSSRQSRALRPRHQVGHRF